MEIHLRLTLTLELKLKFKISRMKQLCRQPEFEPQHAKQIILTFVDQGPYLVSY